MSISWIKPLDGVIDGVNRTFFVPAAFTPVVPGSEAVFVRTLLRRKDYDDGWTVVDYATGEILLNEAPLAGDIVDMFFQQEVTGPLTTTVAGPLIGSISKASESLSGVLGTAAPLQGLLGANADSLYGTLKKPRLSGYITSKSSLTGIIKEC